MTFLPGKPKTGGRTIGTPNKSSTQRAEVICNVRKYSSIDSMINAAEIALARFIEDSEKEDSGRISPMESKAAEYLKIYVKVACEISSYIYPKRKAVEHTNSDTTRDMSPEQRLEAMKHAVELLELQLKQKPINGDG